MMAHGVVITRSIEEDYMPDNEATRRNLIQSWVFHRLGYALSQEDRPEAEQMYQYALQGYEKAISLERISTYISALNTTWNFGFLFFAKIVSRTPGSGIRKLSRATK